MPACLTSNHSHAGLIPQAPLHTASLVVMGYEDPSSASSATAVSDHEDARIATNSHADASAIQLDEVGAGSAELNRTKSGQAPRRRRMSLSEARKKRKAEEEERKGRREIPIAVVEQRVSNLAQGAFCTSLVVCFISPAHRQVSCS